MQHPSAAALWLSAAYTVLANPKYASERMDKPCQYYCCDKKITQRRGLIYMLGESSHPLGFVILN
jgi:hypothetical protein